MLFDLNKYSAADFGRELRLLVGLALPMLIAQVAQVGVGFVDTVMAGGAGKEDLAAVALGSSVFSTIYITFLGVMTALNPIISQLHGAKKISKVGEMGRQGLWFGLTLGLLGMVLMWVLIWPIRSALDLSEHVESMMALYLGITALAMPAAMLHRAMHAYASSLNRPRVIMVVSFLAFLLNIPLNYAFVYGKFGMPALGGLGCGVATTLVFWFNAMVLWLYVAKQPYFQQFGLMNCFCWPDKRVFMEMLRLGVPIGFSFFLEVSLFSCIVFLVARLGEDYVAAQQVVISLTSVIYMIPQSVGSASTVRVGYSLGQREYQRARYIAGVSLVFGLALAVVIAVMLVWLRYPLVGMYTNDREVLHIASTVLLFAAVFQLADCTQCVASYVLRGYKITKVPMLIHAVAFWGLGLLPGYWLAFGRGMGIYGFWTALVLSLSVAAVALVWNLSVCSAEIARERRAV